MDKLLDILNQSSSLPFLFVGSGFSRRYLNLPNWKGLLTHLAFLVDESDFAFAKYEQKAKVSLGDDKSYNALMARIADLIEVDLTEIWYSDPKFEESRTVYKDSIHGGVSPLKIEISKYINELSEDKDRILLQDEVEQLKRIGAHSISGIITTNYDPFLESIFKFTSYASQDDLIFSATYNIGEIYKIHGCCKKPETVMINSKDYAEFSRKNKYLASKLLTIFVENPIIFMGYSLQDEDVKEILESIVDCLDEERLVTLSKRLIFVEWKKEFKVPDFSTSTISFQSGKYLTMTNIKIDDFGSLYSILAQHKSRYPTTVLRKLKKDIYNLVLTNDPQEKLMVLSPDKIVEQEDTEYVVGFGIMELGRRGYESIEAEDIYRDILFNDGNFINELLVPTALPKLLKQTSGSLPFYKYIRGMEPDNLPGKVGECLKDRFDQFKNATILKSRTQENSIAEILRGNYDLGGKARRISALREEQIDIDELYSFLCRTLQETPNCFTVRNLNTDIRRLIKMYDWLVYR